MLTRVSLAPLFALALVASCDDSVSPGPVPQPEDMSPTRPAVVPVAPLFIGTGGVGFLMGSVFPGAAAPRGLAKIAPDTSGAMGTAFHNEGYLWGDDTIRGFSHMHLHGAGVPDYGVVGVMPLDAFDASRTTSKGYESKFDKSTESAVPGKYAVTVSNGGIKVEITATPHAGHHRFTYPAGATAAHLVVDVNHYVVETDDRQGLGGHIKDEVLDIDPATRTLRGSLTNAGGLSGFGTPVYFVARTKQPWTSTAMWNNGGPPGSATHAQGSGVGVDLDFDLGADHAPVELQVGLSLVSIAGAQANLDAEMPTFDFDREFADTTDAWNQMLSVVEVQGGTDQQRAMLQAATYHLFLMPTVQNDVDGTYVGVDKKIAHADGWHYVSDMSLWDTYRTVHPLYDLLAPDVARDAVRSLVAMAKAGGYFPKWPIGDGEGGSMIGASAEVVLADAYIKGVRDFDAEGAYQILRAAAMNQADPPGGRGGRDHVVDYMQYGYVPAPKKDDGGGSASVTIEYGQDDIALSRFAAALGHADDAAVLEKRSHGWQKLYDAESGLLWAKNADGTWWQYPHGGDTVWTQDFVEADAQQSVWGPYYDFDGLVSAMGGKDKLVAALAAFMENGKQNWDQRDWGTLLLAAAQPPTYFWGGNETDVQSPFLFALAGRPDLTQKWVRWTERELYTAGANGLPGDDDGGTTHGTLLESMLGFFAIPGSDVYVLGAPLFPHAVISVAGGSFTIDAHGVSDANLYVQSVTLNGAPLATPVIHHADFRPGGSLVFEMGPAPSAWGQSK